MTSGICLNFIKTLLESKNVNLDTINAPNKEGFSPLDLAFMQKQFRAVEYLITKGAKFARLGSADITNNLSNIIKTLKDDDAPPDELKKIASQIEKLIFILFKQHPNLTFDKKNEEGLTPVFEAASFGNENITRFLLEQKADLHVKDKTGNTLLHAAAPL